MSCSEEERAVVLTDVDDVVSDKLTTLADSDPVQGLGCFMRNRESPVKVWVFLRRPFGAQHRTEQSNTARHSAMRVHGARAGVP
jgi:hypothetical protein